MRKIDKSKQLSTAYKAWENGLENNNTPHPSYNSSNGEYYKDIVMDALRCQNGLCAYTEIQLCPPQYLTADNWENVHYKGIIENRVHNGQLDHFDEQLKWKDKKLKNNNNLEEIEDKTIVYQHKDWLWSNFFVIDSDTNNNKSDKEVDYILKPDSEDYNPFKWLDYSTELHMFTPKWDLPEVERIRIKNMLRVLGINFPNVVYKRRQVIERIIKDPLEADIENQFPTAVEFYKKSKNTEG
jgi:hypothetical protein